MILHRYRYWYSYKWPLSTSASWSSRPLETPWVSGISRCSCLKNKHITCQQYPAVLFSFLTSCSFQFLSIFVRDEIPVFLRTLNKYIYHVVLPIQGITLSLKLGQMFQPPFSQLCCVWQSCMLLMSRFHNHKACVYFTGKKNMKRPYAFSRMGKRPRRPQ